MQITFVTGLADSKLLFYIILTKHAISNKSFKHALCRVFSCWKLNKIKRVLTNHCFLNAIEFQIESRAVEDFFSIT